MKTRRDFLKTAIGTIGFFNLFSSLDFATAEASEIRCSEIPWRYNIYCQFNNEMLKSEIEKCAKEINCTVHHGLNLDMCPWPAFVRVIDRHLVGHDIWEYYISCFDPNFDDIPVFIVDSATHLRLPKYIPTYQFNMNNVMSIPIIIKTCQLSCLFTPSVIITIHPL